MVDLHEIPKHPKREAFFGSADSVSSVGRGEMMLLEYLEYSCRRLTGGYSKNTSKQFGKLMLAIVSLQESSKTIKTCLNVPCNVINERFNML